MRRTALAGALAALVIVAPPASAGAALRADLTVSAVKLTGTQVQGAVRNTGRGKAAKTTLELVVSADGKRDARDTRLATVGVKALARRKTATFRATLRTPSTLAAGRYTVLACADAAKKVREGKETNNCRAAAARLTVAARPAPVTPVTPVVPAAPAPVPVLPGAPAPTATPGPEAPAITSGPAGTVASDAATFGFTGTGPFECRLDGGAWAACTSPRTYTGLLGGAHSFEVRSAHGADRRDWIAAFEAPAPGPTDAPAADPAPRAPAPEPGETTLIGDATKFLYTGANPIQAGVAPGTIAEQRAAVLRGRVRNRMGTAIAGVRVSVLDHPEYGRTATRADGGFDLAVNGGAALTLTLAREGYVPVQRTAEPQPQDYEAVDEITMVPYDDAVTGVRLDTATAPEVVQSSPVTDGDGTRRATLMFEPGTDAVAELPDGSTRALPSELNVRATEFTIGATGPSAMPGELPPTSAYTYAVEYSLDEADALGAVDVRFDRPVATYVDNFLGFPAGTPVPTGYYDRDEARWVAARNGVVIAITLEAGGLAAVDLDGDGVAEDAAELAAAGLDEAERRRLAQLYDPGKSLWRVEVTHFTPWDYNWPYGPPDGSGPPGMGGPEGGDGDGGCNSGGSIIGCENQTLGEEVGVAGTPYMLRYASDRVPGRRSGMALDIPLTPASPPASLARVELEVQVAGQTIRKSFAPAAGLTDTFSWDGRDAYGRAVLGEQPAKVKLSYVYPTVYRQPAAFASAFAAFGGARIAANPTRTEIAASQEWQTRIGGLSAPASSIGGWSLDVHQTYDPVGRTLYMGDGSRRSADGQNFDMISSDVGPPRTGARVSVELQAPEGLVRAADGSLLIADSGAHVIRKVSPAGAVSVIAGTGDPGFAGAGGPAADAELNHPADLALAPDGSIYVADQGNQRVRRIGPDGVIATVAGTGEGGYSGDGGPALAAKLDEPSDVAVAVDGTVYVVDAANHALRRIGPDGTIATVLGNGAPSTSGLRSPRDVALRSDGAVFVADAGNHRVRLMLPDGSVQTVAGDGSGTYRGDGGPATTAGLDLPSAVAPTGDGGFLIADAGNTVVRAVAGDGTITTVAGIPRTEGASGDGGAAPRARIDFPQALLAGPGGSFTFADAGTDRVRTVEPTMPALGLGEFEVPSTTGDQLYVFSQAGRHVRTLDALTGAPLLTFGYDAAGRLLSIADDKDRRTTIERDGAGRPSAIVGPYGHRTTLGTDADGYLSRIADPTGSQVRMEYGSGGLLTKLTDPRDGEHSFGYDVAGRLIRDQNAERGVQTLTRSIDGDAVLVRLRTAEGRDTIYRNETTATGELKRTVTDAAGAKTTVVVGTDGVTSVERADGERETYRLGPDPRFDMLAPVLASTTTLLPSGKARTSETTRTVELADENDPLSLVRLVETHSVNGRTSSVTYEAAGRKLIARSPSGAESVTEIDPARRPLRFSLPGIEPVTFVYDADGRIERRDQGTRVWRYTYNAQGLNATTTDPVGRVTAYSYDLAGRALKRTLPGGREVALEYDAAGSVSGVTPPSRPEHELAYTRQGLISRYTAPGAAAMTLSYDDDDMLEAVDRPGSGDVTLAYDSGARVQQLAEAGRGEVVTFDYLGTTSRRAKVTAPGQTVTTEYDGPLAVKETFSGDAAGVLTRTYDDELRVAASRVGTSTAERGYDDDGLPVLAGQLETTRGANGLVTGTVLGAVTSTQGNDSYGEPVAAAFAGPLGPVYAENVTRDDAGRVVSESREAHTTTFARDDLGRLTGATRDGAPVTYSHDDNGNRLSKTAAGTTVTGSYDDQDRLLRWDTTTYEYQPSGERSKKIAGGTQTTTYDYDARGNLRAVELPDGTDIAYTADGLNRRTAVRRNGTIVARYVYGEAIGPSAEVNASGAVLKRFVYGSRSNVPDYMERDGKMYRFVLDQRGSVRLVVDAETGVIAQRIDYDEYGIVLSDSNAGFQPFGFAGGLYDRDTGLVHFEARDYDPEVGRFTAKDPIGFDGGDPNVYAYAANDPVSFVDPSGEFIPLAIAAAVIGGGLVNGAIEGVKSAVSGCSMGSVLSSAGRGFVSGSVGTAVGFGATAITGNPIAGGVAGGVAAEGVSQAISGNYDMVGVGVAAATGPLSVGGKFLPTRGARPNMWTPRGPGTSRTYGPNSQRIIGQTAIDNAVGNGLGTAANMGYNAMRGCPSSNC